MTAHSETPTPQPADVHRRHRLHTPITDSDGNRAVLISFTTAHIAELIERIDPPPGFSGDFIDGMDWLATGLINELEGRHSSDEPCTCTDPVTCYVCTPYRLLGHYRADEASAALDAHIRSTHKEKEV